MTFQLVLYSYTNSTINEMKLDQKLVRSVTVLVFSKFI